MTLFWEIFGYIGTALVILSMTMTSVKKLRAFNIAGAVVSMIYAAVTATYPVVLLNAVLVVINTYRLIRDKKKTNALHPIKVPLHDEALRHIAAAEKLPIPPEETGREAYLVYEERHVISLLVGKREKDTLSLELDATVKAYRSPKARQKLALALETLGIFSLVPIKSGTLALSHNSHLKGDYHETDDQ